MKGYTGFLVFGLKIGPKLATVLGKLISVKFGLASASALSYSMLFTWEFAVMIMLMLFVH